MVREYTRRMKAEGKPIPAKGIGAAHYAGPAFEAPDVEDDALLDGDTAREAVAALRSYAGKPGQPFFLAVGFSNPHVPWVAPKKYFDLYNPQDLKLPENAFPPKGAPAFAAQTGADFTWYAGVPENGKPDAEYGRRCLHAYLAAISYVDAQVGRLLAALEETGLAETTAVVFWGDHGYYMGEHGWWGGKHNNYEGATRVPLIVAVPGQKAAGRKTDALVELVDLYPTLADTCRLPAPQGTEGTSFKPLLDDPGRAWKKAAFSWYPKGGRMGVAMRTDRHRYVEWSDKSGAVAAVELYDHQSNPHENLNVADRAENKRLLEELRARMRAGWAGARP
jgi:iduronate 2-sulfatase